MFTTGVQRPLKARHYLPNEEGPEGRDHQHPYVVEWRVRVPALDAKGYGTDIAWMERTLEAILGSIDGVLLNDLPAFSASPPSLENLCVYLWERCAASGLVGQAGGSMSLRIWENEQAWAQYDSVLTRNS